MNKTTEILGVRLDLLNFSEILGLVEQKIQDKQKTKIYTVNNEFIVEAQKNKKFQNVLNNSDLNVIDSTGVVWAIKKLKNIRSEKTPGVDLFWKICNLANINKLKIFLLGGRAGAGRISKQKIEAKYPDLKIDYLDSVRIDESMKDGKLIEKINSFHPDIVFVALGAPKQEFWIEGNYKDVEGTIFMGIGGTLDFVSGLLKRAPAPWRKFGLEWLYRLFRQPSRYKRIYKAVFVFSAMVRKARADT